MVSTIYTWSSVIIYMVVALVGEEMHIVFFSHEFSFDSIKKESKQVANNSNLYFSGSRSSRGTILYPRPNRAEFLLHIPN